MRSRGSLLLEVLLVLAVMVVAVPFLMQKEFRRREAGQNQAIAHRVRQLGMVALSYMRDQPILKDGLNVLSDSDLVRKLKPYGLSENFETVDRYGQQYEVHLKQERDAKDNISLTGFVVVYLPDGLSDTISFLRRRRMAEAVGAMGAILEEDGSITSSAGIWEMTQEEWGYSLPPFSILMALQETDISYTFLSRFKIDELGQGNTFLVDLNMSGKDIKDVNALYVKNLEAGDVEVNNLAVLEGFYAPVAKFDSLTVDSIVGNTSFFVSGPLHVKSAETRRLYLGGDGIGEGFGTVETLKFTQGEFKLTFRPDTESENTVLKLQVDNALTLISNECEPVSSTNSSCKVDDLGNDVPALREFDWDEYVPVTLTLNSAVKGLQDKLLAPFTATLEVHGELSTSRIFFERQFDANNNPIRTCSIKDGVEICSYSEYAYLLDFLGTQTLVEDVSLDTGNFLGASKDSGKGTLSDTETLKDLIRYVYGDENQNGFYIRFLNFMSAEIQ
ncbi:MAG: hypothetical protein JW812_02805 [Alphaproteobacteria bacterium]|nr:hypothetical protein [Alphaproteobacteria bacterium]MBN2779891.1 hypothetical protein [Alphaproteobacteria bacterium]